MIWVWSYSPVLAVNSPSEKIPLTLEILQERVKNPVNTEGTSLIDLENFIIDLREKNAEFSQQFYQKIQTHFIFRLIE